MRKSSKNFTLIEVMAALAIFALAIVPFLSALSTSARRLTDAERTRYQTQCLANAVEFFLLNPPEASLDKKFFPYEDVNVVCHYEEPILTDDEMELEIGNQRLVRMVVELRDNSGNKITGISIDRIVEASQ